MVFVFSLAAKIKNLELPLTLKNMQGKKVKRLQSVGIFLFLHPDLNILQDRFEHFVIKI